MDRVVALIDSALKLAVEIQVKLLTTPERSFSVNCWPDFIVNTSDIQASSGPKLVDFKAALVKPENEVVTGLTLVQFCNSHYSKLLV